MKHPLLIIILLATFQTSFAQIKNPADDGRKIRIPVVFHVLYSNSAENINDSFILNELTDLNVNFSATNSMTVLDNDFRNIVGNPNIEFYLLDTLFQGSTVKGIQRRLKNTVANTNDLLINATTCLNVFIADQGNASDILSQRVNLNYEDVGQNTHVLTHETGHWLGLYHIWGKVGSCNRFKLLFSSHDDDIDDTPTQYTCTELRYVTDCPPRRKLHYKKHKILYNNFMDYNGCRCMFTIGQSTQMRNNIIEHKPSLFNADNKATAN